MKNFKDKYTINLCKREVKKMKKVEMERIFLRESTFDDCEYFAKWEQMETVTEFFTIDKGRDYQEVVTEFISRQKDDDKIQLTICSKEDERPIGRIYISNIDNHYDSLDITRIYIADKAIRGTGLGEEALRAALKLAFEDLNRERVTLDHFTGNQIASHLYIKVGFQYEGVMRHGGKKDGKYLDLHLMSMLRDEYFAQKESPEK